MNWKSNLFLLILLSLVSNSCGVYSFTGASIDASVKTISIQQFYNNAPLGPANMSVMFTEKIKDYFLQNTSLTLVEEDGDLQIEGSIDNYTLSPVAPASSSDPNAIDLTSQTRITIFVGASYVNVKNDEFDFDKSFSFFLDYDQNTVDLASNEEQFVDEIFDQIVLDIFNSSVANW